MRAKAVLDLGTNTFSLMVFNPVSLQTLHQAEHAVKLGQISLQIGISEEAQNRAISCLKQFKHDMLGYQVSEYLAIGTSALRSAPNAPQFISRVQNECGLHILVINGQQEARLIFDGVIQHAPKPDELSLVMDIGGGSVEFCIGSKQHLNWFKSYEIGCSRLLNWQKWNDPLLQGEKNQLTQFINQELSELYIEMDKQTIKTFIGAAGSFNSLLALSSSYGVNEMTSKQLNYQAFLAIQQKVSNANLAERYTWPGLEGFKAEMIPFALLLIQAVWSKLTPSVSLLVASQSLKEGVIIHQQQFLWQPF